MFSNKLRAELPHRNGEAMAWICETNRAPGLQTTEYQTWNLFLYCFVLICFAFLTGVAQVETSEGCLNLFDADYANGGACM